MGGHGTDRIERKALTFNVQRYNVFDGPGVRTIIFFKGCPLRCQWCSNPEGLERRIQVLFKEKACTNCGACAAVCPVGIHVMEEKRHQVRRDIQCIGCRKCKTSCPGSALEIVGEEHGISELLSLGMDDAPFYAVSGGGVTLGGGECTMQAEAAQNLLMAYKTEGINTAIETSGYVKTSVLLGMAEYVDLFLYDIKHMDPQRHNELTGMDNELILFNLRELLRRHYNVRVRMPLLKGLNDQPETIRAAAEFLRPYRDDSNFKGIELLPYHKYGISKYRQIGKTYPLTDDPSMEDSDLSRIEGWFREYGLPARRVRH